MIVKELPATSSIDPLLRAGYAAEEQMAYYLRRAFAADNTLHVFNNLRLAQAEDAAQIDHLVLHRWGVIIIESKSVASRVVVNEHGEWTRCFRGHTTGMPSPILQAQRQGEFLREYLIAHRETLMGKLWGRIQRGFRHMPLDVLVAISDSGVIDRPRSQALPEVCKADQTPDRVRAIVRQHQRENSIFNLNPAVGGYEFTTDEQMRVRDFLLAQHQPVAPPAVVTIMPSAAPAYARAAPLSAPQATPPQPKPCAPAATTACRHCASNELSIQWGQYGYYFKCGQCSGNTPIRQACAGCGGKAKIRKSGLRFFAECQPCGASLCFYVNAV